MVPATSPHQPKTLIIITRATDIFQPSAALSRLNDHISAPAYLYLHFLAELPVWVLSLGRLFYGDASQAGVEEAPGHCTSHKAEVRYKNFWSLLAYVERHLICP